MTQTKILLDESEIPTHWYNVVSDFPNPPSPPLGPDGQPIGPEALAPLFPMALIAIRDTLILAFQSFSFEVILHITASEGNRGNGPTE